MDISTDENRQRKERLLRFVPFLRKVTSAVPRPTNIAKWEKVLWHIIDDTKILQESEIDEMYNSIEHFKKNCQSQQLKKSIADSKLEQATKEAAPLPVASIKPTLSISEVDELIGDLSSPVKLPDFKASTSEPKKEPQNMLLKMNLKKHQSATTIRRVYIPNSPKVLWPMKKAVKPITGNSLVSQSSPKVTNVRPSQLQKKEKLLKQVDIYKSIEQSANKLTTFSRALSSPTSPKSSLATRISLPLANKKGEFAKKVDGEKRLSAETVPVVLKMRKASETVNVEQVLNEEPLEDSADFEGDNAKSNDIKGNVISLVTPTTSTEDQPKPTTSSESRISKELKRLQENIVKDSSPLPSRRSCTLKRVSAGYCNSPGHEGEYEEIEKQTAKKIKSDKAETKTTPPEQKVSESPKKKIDMKSPAKIKSSVEGPSLFEIKTGRTTRRSVAVAEKLENISKDFDLKSCSVSLLTPDEKPPATKLETLPNANALKKDQKRKAEESSHDHKNQSSEMIYKTVCNIGFGKSRDGFILKCLIKSCTSQSLDKYRFVNHLEKLHATERWNGHCNTCQEFVLPEEEGGYSLMNEFIHMEEHKNEEREFNEFKRVKVNAQQPGSDLKPKKLKDNIELMDGIDTILNILDCSQASDGDETSPSESPSIKIADQKGNHDKSASVTKVATVTEVCKANATVSTPAAQKTVSGIVGRVINISQIPGLSGKFLSNAKKITMPSNLVTAKQPEFPNLVNKQPEVYKSVNSINLSITKVPSCIQVRPMSSLLAVTPAKPEAQAECKQIKLTADTKMTAPIKNVAAENKASERKFLPIKIRDETVQCLNDPLRHDEMLRPWCGVRTKKNTPTSLAMLTPYCLAATYKCLGTNCRFYSIDNYIFSTHLSFHEKFNGEDKANFLACSYCRYVAADSKSLIIHININHQYDKYQCIYCFYRSCVPHNVIIHQNSFHIMKPRKVMKLKSEKFVNFGEAVKVAIEQRKLFVPKILCVCGESSHYIFRQFKAHLDEHPPTMTIICFKCGEKTNKSTIHKHIVACHGLGLYQCVYCRFGTSTSDIMANHMANEHPSKLTFYCERSVRKGTEEIQVGDIAGTNLKQVKIPVENELYINAPINETALKNYNKVGALGQTIQIEGIVSCKPKFQTVLPKPAVVNRPIDMSQNRLSVGAVKKPVQVQRRLSVPAVSHQNTFKNYIQKTNYSAKSMNANTMAYWEKRRNQEKLEKASTASSGPISSSSSNSSSAAKMLHWKQADVLKAPSLLKGSTLPGKPFHVQAKAKEPQLTKLHMIELQDKYKLGSFEKSTQREHRTSSSSSSARDSPTIVREDQSSPVSDAPFQIQSVVSLTEGSSYSDWYK